MCPVAGDGAVVDRQGSPVGDTPAGAVGGTPAGGYEAIADR